jgi:hypothetical protein
MSKSYKKNPFFSCRVGSFKSWKQEINRTYRTKCKQLINNCKDWDNLIIPIIDEVGNFYNSPKDCYGRYQEKPFENQCLIDEYERLICWEYHFKWRYTLNKKRHHKYCNCYGNKRGWYWKMMRK